MSDITSFVANQVINFQETAENESQIAPGILSITKARDKERAASSFEFHDKLGAPSFSLSDLVQALENLVESTLRGCDRWRFHNIMAQIW
jgi:hypothetical protein